MMTEASARLRDLLASPGLTYAPAVYDCLSARLAVQAGFDMLFTSGYGMSASLLGAPDLGQLTATEVLTQARHICGAVDIPVIVDVDTGYGNEVNVRRTICEAIQGGAAGVILEDQQWPKRCGHFDGKSVIPTADHVRKIEAAVRARGESGLVIVARTDVRAIEGLAAAIDRGRAYAAAGADVVFVEAPQSAEELAIIARELSDVWLFANMIEGGKTPLLSIAELDALGYKLCAFALTGLFAATKAMQENFQHLRKHGTSQGNFSFGEFAEVIDLASWTEKR